MKPFHAIVPSWISGESPCADFLLLSVMVGGVATADRAREPAAGAPVMHQPPPSTRPQPLRPEMSEADFVGAHRRSTAAAGSDRKTCRIVAQLAKQVGGMYSCKGVTLNGDGSSTPLAAKLTVKLALDTAWIAVTFAAKDYAFEDYRTYDATAKQWTRIQLVSTSAHVISTTLGEKAGTWMWEGTESSSVGTKAVRDYEQLAARQIKVWGEAMLSGSWQKTYEATCKR